MGNYFGGGTDKTNGPYLQIPLNNIHQFSPMGGSSSSVSGGGTVGGTGGENGQWNFMSSGSSSYHDGKQQYTGSQMYSNLNGEIHHETTGNMPEGFFQTFSAPTATVSAIVLVSMVMMFAMFSIFNRMARKNQQRRQLELRNRRNLMMTTFNSGRDLTEDDDHHNQNQGPYFNQQKRPFSDVMWNSELLADDQFVKVNLHE